MELPALSGAIRRCHRLAYTSRGSLVSRWRMGLGREGRGVPTSEAPTVTKATCTPSSRLVRIGGGGLSSDGVDNTCYILEQTSFLKEARPSPGHGEDCRQDHSLAIHQHGRALLGGCDGARVPERSPPLGSSGAPADVGPRAQERMWGSDFETSRGWVGRWGYRMLCALRGPDAPGESLRAPGTHTEQFPAPSPVPVTRPSSRLPVALGHTAAKGLEVAQG